MPGHWTKTLIGRCEVLILSFKTLFYILSAFVSSAKSEYDGSDMFSSFLQYEWPSDSKGIADQLEAVLHMTAGCDLGLPN